ncbi:hypothetical protein BAE44_0002451, partial [Dichanthelium oligosanthes]
WKPITNINDPKIQGLGQCAVHEQDRLGGDHLIFINVVRGRQRGEMTYELVINASERESDCYKAVVFNFDLNKPEYCRLLSFDDC